jgi:hypothetical protein
MLHVQLFLFIMLCTLIVVGVAGVFGIILMLLCAIPVLFLFALL